MLELVVAEIHNQDARVWTVKQEEHESLYHTVVRYPVRSPSSFDPI